jgi:hypothetical protein
MSFLNTKSTVAAVGAAGLVAALLSSTSVNAFTTPTLTGGLTLSRLQSSTSTITTLTGTTISFTTSTSSIPIGQTITLAAPTGLNFQISATATCSGTTTSTLTPQSYSQGATSITYLIGGAACTGNVIFGNLGLGGMVSFAASSSNTSVLLTVSSSLTTEVSTVAGVITAFATPVTYSTYASAYATALTVAPNNVSIDIAQGALKFAAGTTGTTSITIGSLAASTILTTALDADGSTAVTVNANTAVVTASGDFSAFSTVYAVASPTTCATSAPSAATTATINSTATSASLTLNTGVTTGYNICGILNGTTVVKPSSYSASAVTTLSNSRTQTSSQAFSQPTVYNGTSATINYYVGSVAGFGNYINVVNGSASSAAVIYVLGKSATGAQTFATLDSALAAGAQKRYAPSDVKAALGTGYVYDTGSIGNVTVFSTQSGTSITSLLVSPNLTVNNIQ